MRALAPRLAAALLLAGVVPARALDWEASLDVRAIASDAGRSFVEGGAGKLRWGSDRDGLRLGRARLALRQPAGETLLLHLDASAWGDRGSNVVDVTEAYAEWRPYPREGWRVRGRLGLFYPPQTLANRAGGWETPYTLAASAIDAWIAEEIRTAGADLRIERLGTRTGGEFDATLALGVFGWNDPAGVMIANHGFAIHDRQLGWFGHLGRSGSPAMPRRELFHEIDGRAGFYAGGDLKYRDAAALRALHYDNRGDPRRFDAALGDFAWLTRFDTVSARLESPSGWTGIAEWLDGYTRIDPPGMQLEWRFRAWNLLLSRRAGPHTVSARYDRFEVQAAPAYLPRERGHAVTVSYGFEPDERWRFMVEGTRVPSRADRRRVLGEAPFAVERSVQLSVRYALHGTLRGTP